MVRSPVVSHAEARGFIDFCLFSYFSSRVSQNHGTATDPPTCLHLRPAAETKEKFGGTGLGELLSCVHVSPGQ